MNKALLKPIGTRPISTSRPAFSATSPAIARRRQKPARLLSDHIAYYVGGMGTYYFDLFTRYGYGEEASLIRQAWMSGDRSGAASMVSRDMLDNITITGDEDECRGKLSKYRDNGATSPVVGCPHGCETEVVPSHPPGTGAPTLMPIFQIPAKAAVMERITLDRFRLEGLLGSGSDYEVHAATDVETGQQVVVKRPRPDYIARGLHTGIDLLSEVLIGHTRIRRQLGPRGVQDAGIHRRWQSRKLLR